MRRAGTSTGWLALWVLFALLTGGCLDDGEKDPAEDMLPGPDCPGVSTTNVAPGAPSPVPLPVREGFETTSPGSIPAAWRVLDGRWGAEINASAAAGSRVLRGQGDPGPGFSSILIGSAGDVQDFTLSFAVRMGCIEHPHGVGAVLHVAGPEDYQIVRYSATESAWDLFTVNGGVRVRQDEAAIRPGTVPQYDDVLRITITSAAGRVQAFHGDQQVIDHQLVAEDAASGQVGLFLRGNADAWFDEVVVDGLLPAG